VAETITAAHSGHCLVCGRTIPRGEERLELDTEAQWINAKVMGAVCRRCVAESVLAAISQRLERDAVKDTAKLANQLGVEPAHFARATRHVEKAERQRKEFQ
jgi:hypothetical protein